MADAVLNAQQPQQISQDKRNVYERHALRPNSNTTRVLDVQPVPRHAIEGTPVICTVRVIDLDRKPDFTALSYVWGDPEDKGSIICDGILFEVTRNCYSALWHLSKKLDGLTVWVDAICIDQEDNSKEKIWQLPLMGHIYTKARRVYAWLGEGDKRSDQVMGYLSRGGLRTYVQSTPGEPPRYRPYVAALRFLFAGWRFGYHPLPFRRGKKPVLAYFSHRFQYINWNDLDYVLDRPWRSRIWTYQEILLASHPVIVCGSEHVEWSDLEWALLLLRSTSDNLSHVRLSGFKWAFLLSPKTSDNLSSAVAAWEIIAFDRGKMSSAVRPTEPNVLHSLQEHEKVVAKILAARRILIICWFCLSLAYGAVIVLMVVFASTQPAYAGWMAAMMLVVLLLAWFELRIFPPPYRSDFSETTPDSLVGALYQRTATNRRDMAYGIWAILRNLGATDLPKPAYDSDDETQIPLVYWQLTKNLLQMTGNLQILYIAATQRLQGTPSWVPDWSSFKSNAWRDLPELPGTHILGRKSHLPSEINEMLKKERTYQRISIGPTRKILTVLAKDTGAICGCISFQSTSKTLDALERNSHLENMRAMLQWAIWAENIGCKILSSFFPPQNHELALEVTPLSAGATEPSWREQTQWEKIFAKPGRDKLNIYLTHWMDGVKVPRWFVRFMSTQIYLCNLLAELQRKICHVSIFDEPGKFRLLICSEETQVNDRLIRLCGLPSSIVMRKHGELANSVSIIGPTAIQGQGARRKSKSRYKGSKISLENQFAEYHIH